MGTDLTALHSPKLLRCSASLWMGMEALEGVLGNKECEDIICITAGYLPTAQVTFQMAD